MLLFLVSNKIIFIVKTHLSKMVCILSNSNSICYVIYIIFIKVDNRFITSFRHRNKRSKRKPCPLPRMRDIGEGINRIKHNTYLWVDYYAFKLSESKLRSSAALSGNFINMKYCPWVGQLVQTFFNHE